MTDKTETDTFYRDALDSAKQGVWDYNIETGKKFYSEVWYQLRGLTADAELYSELEWFKNIHPDDRHLAEGQTKQLNAGEIDSVNYEYRERHADGHWVWIMCRGRAVEWNAQNRPIRFVGTDTDISALKAFDEELQHAQKKLQFALSSIGAGVWEYRSVNNTIEWDERQRVMYGLPPDKSPLPRDVWERSIHPDDLGGAIKEADNGLLKKVDYCLAYRIIRNDGAIRHIRSHVSFLEEDGHHYSLVGLDLDVTEDWERSEALKQANQIAKNRNKDLERARYEIEQIALFDTLTGLANRHCLNDIQNKIRFDTHDQNRGPAILLMDLDGFKDINSVFGHSAGDYVLRRTADIVKNIGGSDAFPARTGGDEFALFLPNPPDDDVLAEMAGDLIKQVSQPIIYENFNCRVGMSVGIARTDPDVIDTTQLLRDADLALNKAKASGRQHYAFCEPALRNEAVQMKKLADELLVAVEMKEFNCAYQAQFDMKTGEISGVEALARWPRPDGTIIQPSEFLPVAEVMGLISVIDGIILDKAVADFQLWNKISIKVPRISVNISKSRLRDKNLVSDIRSFDIDPTMLSLELLESSFLEEYDPCIAANLEGLRQSGVGLEVDDFGTGHASILSLLQLEPDRLKIDRAFIEPLQKSYKQVQLVRSIIEIGHLLGMKIIAEGVETEDQFKTLCEMNCDYVQGYLLSRPLFFNDFTKKFAS